MWSWTHPKQEGFPSQPQYRICLATDRSPGHRLHRPSRPVSGLWGWDKLTLPPGPGKRWVPARMLHSRWVSGQASPLPPPSVLWGVHGPLLPLGWTARPLTTQPGWDKPKPREPRGVVVAQGHLARPGISASSGPHEPRWPHWAEEGRAKGHASGHRRQVLASTTVQAPAAQNNAKSLLSSDLEEPDGLGAALGPHSNKRYRPNRYLKIPRGSRVGHQRRPAESGAASKPFLKAAAQSLWLNAPISFQQTTHACRPPTGTPLPSPEPHYPMKN